MATPRFDMSGMFLPNVTYAGVKLSLFWFQVLDQSSLVQEVVCGSPVIHKIAEDDMEVNSGD